MEGTDQAVVTVFEARGEDEGLIGLVLQGTPMCIFDDKLMPGCSMTPENARHLAQQLIDIADYVESGK